MQHKHGRGGNGGGHPRRLPDGACHGPDGACDGGADERGDRHGRRDRRARSAGHAQRPEGNLFTVEATEEVRNLPQVEVGDRVMVSYYEAIAAQIATPGQEASASVTATRTPAGARPGGVLAQEVTETVRITDLDPATHSVSFTDPEGLAQTIAVQDPKMRDFLKTLKVGDEVAVTYTEALAISVEPASP